MDEGGASGKKTDVSHCRITGDLYFVSSAAESNTLLKAVRATIRLRFGGCNVAAPQ
jgi:hypothetical protein